MGILIAIGDGPLDRVPPATPADCRATGLIHDSDSGPGAVGGEQASFTRRWGFQKQLGASIINVEVGWFSWHGTMRRGERRNHRRRNQSVCTADLWNQMVYGCIYIHGYMDSNV